MSATESQVILHALPIKPEFGIKMSSSRAGESSTQDDGSNLIEPAAPDANFMAYAGAGVGVLAVIFVLISVGLYRRRVNLYRRKSPAVEAFSTTRTHATDFDTSMQSTSMTGNGTTMIAGNEIALPGYLQVQNSLDYAVDKSQKPLASGGGGTIYLGKFLNYGVGQKMIREGVTVCVVKEVKQTAIAVFKQEVALMHYFRSTPTIIELYGYNELQ